MKQLRLNKHEIKTTWGLTGLELNLDAYNMMWCDGVRTYGYNWKLWELFLEFRMFWSVYPEFQV